MKVNDLENKLHKMYIICQKIVKEKSDHYIKRVNDLDDHVVIPCEDYLKCGKYFSCFGAS